MALTSRFSRVLAATTACAALCLAAQTNAQCTGYVVTPGPGAFVAGTTDIGLYADDGVLAVTLPFAFNFYGTSYTSVTVSSNGTLQFGSASAVFFNNCLPSATFAGATIFPFWDDLYTAGGVAAGQGVFTDLSGVAGSQVFVIEYRAVYFGQGAVPPTQDFEVKFYENQNYFDIVYSTPMSDRASATIGCQAGGAPTDAFTQYVCNTPGPTSGVSLRFVCDTVTAACCAPNGTCSVVSIAGCLSPSIAQAPGSTCSGAGGTCPTPTLACCDFLGACVFAVGTCPTGSTPTAGSVCTPTSCVVQPSICEGLENVSPGTLPVGWTSVVTGAAPNAVDWSVGNTTAHTGTNSLFTNDVDHVQDQILTLPAVTAGGNLTLDFWSSFTTENTYDGWVVEYSTDGGVTWTDVGQAGWLLNGYNNTISAAFMSTIAGQRAFSGAFPAWTERACTIPAALGQQVSIRFHMASDTIVASLGVNLDDICIYNIQVGSGACCASNGSCAIASNTACTGLFRGVGSTCGAGATCPGDVGKCCNNTTGTCTLAPGAAACGGAATYGGQGTSCANSCVSVSTCCDNTTGACTAIFGGSCAAGLSAGTGASCGPNSCLSVSTCCDNATGVCNAIFGGSCTASQTAGTGATCGPNSCPPVATCCNNTTGVCAAIFGGSCAAGTSPSTGTTCGPNSCPSLSTCCNPATGECTAIFGGSCAAGLDAGAGTSCGPNSCQYGACCGGCAGCTILPMATCTGTYGGNGTTCAAICPNDGYTVAPSPTSVTFIPAVDDIGLYADDAQQAVTLPFPVNFYGVPYNSVNACTNGFLEFNTVAAIFFNGCLPNAAIAGPAIFPFWDDQRTDIVTGAGIFTTTTGVAPNRTFVIEWRTYYYGTVNPTTVDQDYEVLLYEGRNYFDVVYGTPFADRSSATIGVQANGAAGSPFTEFECNVAGPTSGQAIRFNCGVAATNGACCNNTSGVCSSTTLAACLTGSTFQGLGTSCTPNPCPQPPAGVCCRGSTCSTTVTTAAACTGSLIAGQLAGAAFPTAAACNSGGSTTTPCCYADYNKTGGITVQDIFDYLGDWFAGSPYANTGGTGAPGLLSAQNIFDFLTAWFNSGC